MTLVWIWGDAVVPAPAQAPAPAPDAAKFVESAQMRQSRLTIEALTQEILEIDGQIERRVDKLLSMLIPVTDSADSGRKIANQKEELMAGLKRSIDWYRQERAKRQAMLTAPYAPIPTEDLAKGLAILDDKVEKRIEQILEVSASLAGHQDVAKYERYYDDRYGETDLRVSEEYRHNQRVSGKSARAQEGVREGLEKSIQALEREEVTLKQGLATARDPEKRRVLEEQLTKNTETQALRREQIYETVRAASSERQPVSSREATSLDRLMQDMVKEIQHDFRRLEGLVNQLRVERERLTQFGYR